MNLKALNALSYGMYILSARQGDRDNGCIINAAIQVTDRPNRIAAAVNKGSLTREMAAQTGKFTLSVLSEQAPFELFRLFGFQSGREADKFSQLGGDVGRDGDGLPYVTRGTNAWLSCQVISALDLGTHTLFVANVVDGQTLSSAPSAAYAYYLNHIKPGDFVSAAPNKKRWVCKVCGFVYEGDELPEAFICPWCKHPASDFEELA